MKKKIFLFLLLSVMMVYYIAPFISKFEQNSNINSTVLSDVKNNMPTIKESILVENPRIDLHKQLNDYINSEIEKMNLEMQSTNSIDNKKEWFNAYKEIINKYSGVLDPPETIYDYYSKEELDLLFHVVQAEAGDEYPFEEKANVASVIFNRLRSEKFSGNMFAILLEKNQFQPIRDGRYKEVIVSEDTILACEYSFMIENTAQGCLFFDSDNTLEYDYVFSDSAHNFYQL